MSTRTAIIDLGREQLRAGGYAHLNFRTIAEELSITRAAVHYHFEDKDSLAGAALDDHVAASMAAMEQLVHTAGGDLGAYVAAVERLVVDRLRSGRPAPGCACAQVVDDADAPAALRRTAADFFAAKHARVRELALAARDAGTLVADADVGALALLVTSHLLGVERLSRVTREPGALADDVEGAAATLLAPWLA